MLHYTHAPVGPLDPERIYRVTSTDAECQDIVDARLKSTRRLLFLIQTVFANSKRDLRTDSESILSVSLELYLQVSILRKSARVVPIDESLVIDVADNEVERSVA